MNSRKRLILILVLASMAGAAFALVWLRDHQRLGQPGIVAEAIPGSPVMKIELPAKVLDYTSSNVPQTELVLGYLPKDTSFAQRYYWAPDGFWVNANIILMGSDRTSIHKPDYCLVGQGFSVYDKAVLQVPIGGPQPYELPVARWLGRKMVKNQEGQDFELHAVYVFWFVADKEQTVDNTQRVRWLMRDMLLKGVLQRWAYVSYLTVCAPGQEDATVERLKQLIAASVPEFQLPPAAVNRSAAAVP